MSDKTWGDEPFWGLGYDWDPDWVLTERQKELREKLIELCEKEMRANAKRSDDELLFPRRNFEILAEHGFLVADRARGVRRAGREPRRLRDDRARRSRATAAPRPPCATSCTSARSRRSCCAPRRADRASYIRPLNELQDRHALLLRPGDRLALLVPDLLGRRALQRRLQGAQEGVVDDLGRLRRLLRRPDDEPGLHRLRRPRRCSSSTASTSSPSRRCGTRWACAATSRARSRSTTSRSPPTRSSGRSATAPASNDEAVDPWFLIGSSSVWNGIAMGAIDIAKRHTTRKRHVDVGMRVADYPTIQDYVGEAVMDTNASPRVRPTRSRRRWTAPPTTTAACSQPGETARADYLHWAWQIKFEAAKNIAHVVDKMLHACGGSGYKRDMELERYLRDAKAGWVMGPTNEVLRQFVGKAVLLGFDALDYWNQTYNRRVVENEVKKLDADGKRELAEQLLRAGREGRGEGAGREGVRLRCALRGRPRSAGRPRPASRYWVRPGGGDRRCALRARRPRHGDRPRRRPGRRS